MAIEDEFRERLSRRQTEGLLRILGPGRDLSKTDFFSNDYLGLSRDLTSDFAGNLPNPIQSGSTGSRLVSGNYRELEELEAECAQFFHAPACLFFANGFLANLALISSVGTKNDTYLYDEKCHVSLKDGMRLSLANRFSFRHNDPEDLKRKLKNNRGIGNRIVVVESIYSMDGDTCALAELLNICETEGAYLIVDEAHSTGNLGPDGRGLVAALKLETKPLAIIYTFGKSLGAAGAVVACSETTRNYLINFSHPFIYSTAPSPIQIWLCRLQLTRLKQEHWRLEQIQSRIRLWQKKVFSLSQAYSSNPQSPVQFISVAGNEVAKSLFNHLQKLDIQIKPMLSPTVPKGKERIRVSLHAYNSEAEIDRFLEALKEFENNFRLMI